MSPQNLDPKTWLDGVDARWNAHDLDGAMAYFTPDAVATFVPPLPGAPDPAVGYEQIRTVVRSLLPGFHVTSRNHARVGDTVTWAATASNDAFRSLGIDYVEGLGEAVLEGEKMKSFRIVFTPETLARLQAAMARQASA